MDQEKLEQELNGLGLGAIRYYPRIGSTNTDAMQWIEQGAPDFSLVIADEQTAGRGRFQRKWVTNPGAALAFTVIMHPAPDEMGAVHLFSPLAGVAVSSALESSLHLHSQIKWPNDVLVNRKKICGILTETVWTGGQLHGIVIGIGINITERSIPPEEMLSFPATCVEQFTHTPVDRWEVLRAVLHNLKTWRKKLKQPDFYRYWEEHLAFKGEQVDIRGTVSSELTGTLMGINPSGELLIETDMGEVAVQVGDVHLRLHQN
jgi:BirA family transcriptional regulator, biotin operon repressor / biotin---[acetyl-CoA-carboxylase] ligase